ncbi:Protein FAM179B, partial [Pterocles gutturalis]
QAALETTHRLIPLLKDRRSPAIVPGRGQNRLGSPAPGIYAAATSVLQALCKQQVYSYVLLQPFCAKAPFLAGKGEHDRTEKLA